MSVHFFRLKYKSSIHNIASSSEEVILSESGEKYAQIKHHLHTKTKWLQTNMSGF